MTQVCARHGRRQRLSAPDDRETIQDDEQLYDLNVVTFTAQADIDPFNDIGSDVLYIGEFFGIQFSFSGAPG